jgi:hypothetical protein
MKAGINKERKEETLQEERKERRDQANNERIKE